MKNLHDAVAAIALSEDARVEDYLDHLCAPLVGVMPYAERVSLRLEVRLHLEELAVEFGHDGVGEGEALERALAEMGEPWVWGEALLREHLEQRAGGRGDPRRLPTTIQALAWFGPTTVFCLLLAEAYVLLPGKSGLLIWLLVVAVLGPFVSGVAAGLAVPGDAGEGVRRGLPLLSGICLVVGMLLWPKTEGLVFGLFHLVFWFPAGWLAATAAAATMRQHRRVHFLRASRSRAVKEG